MATLAMRLIIVFPYSSIRATREGIRPRAIGNRNQSSNIDGFRNGFADNARSKVVFKSAAQ